MYIINCTAVQLTISKQTTNSTNANAADVFRQKYEEKLQNFG